MLTPYQDSGGEYGLGINTVAGYLMALHSECPREARDDGGGLAPWKPLPDLQHWADVAFIAYKEQCKLDSVLVTGLRYVFRCEIKNEETLKVIRAICDRFPGLPLTMNMMTFDASSAQGKALIATPNGAGVVWMLLRHRQYLGKMLIKQVILMANPELLSGTSPRYDGPHLCFELADNE